MNPKPSSRPTSTNAPAPSIDALISSISDFDESNVPLKQLCPYDGFKFRIKEKAYIDFLLLNQERFNLQSTTQNFLPLQGKIQGFTTTVYETKEYGRVVEIGGSFHKYFFNGRNYQHFYWSHFVETYYMFLDLFSLDPQLVTVVNIEVGVNVYIPNWWRTDAKKIIHGILYLNPRTKSRRKHILEFKDFGLSWCSMHHHYHIKIYDKSSQNFLFDENIIRLEKKHVKSEPLEKYGIFTMKDLVDFEVRRELCEDLVKTLSKLIIYQHELDVVNTLNDNDKSFLLQYCKSEAWEEAHKDRNLWRQVGPRYLKIVKTHCIYNLKDELMTTIKKMTQNEMPVLAEFTD